MGGARELMDRILAWLVEEGNEVQKTPVPREAPVEWSLLVKVKAPLVVNISIQKAKGLDKLVFTMLVKLSPEHLAAFKSLPPKSRASLVADIIVDSLKVCPTCIVVNQPPKPEETEAFIASREAPLELVDRRLVSETVRVLANIYQLIVVRVSTALEAGRAGGESPLVM